MMKTWSAPRKGAIVGAVSALVPWILIGAFLSTPDADVVRLGVLCLHSVLAGIGGGIVLGWLADSLDRSPRWGRRIALVVAVPVVEAAAFGLASTLALLLMAPWTPEIGFGGAFGGGLVCAVYGTVLAFPACAIGCLVLEAWTYDPIRQIPRLPVEVFD